MAIELNVGQIDLIINALLVSRKSWSDLTLSPHSEFGRTVQARIEDIDETIVILRNDAIRLAGLDLDAKIVAAMGAPGSEGESA